MKRYILILSVILAVFTSCTNDDITISYTPKGYTTNFKIDPSTVIAPFESYESGELEGIHASYRLRIRLLIYDASGTLVADDEQLFTSYATVMASSKSLPKGNYIAIAVSDIVAKDNSEEFWTLTGVENLSNATIKAGETIGDYGLGILGVEKTSFVVVGDNKNEDIVINIKPAGSLFLIFYLGVQKYPDAKSYELSVSKDVIDCKFDSQGNFSPSWENCDFINRVNVHNQEGNTGDDYYHYAYILPTSNLKMKYRYTTDEKIVNLTPEMNVSPRAGEEYMVELNLHKNTYSPPKLVNGPDRAVAAFSNKAKRGNLIHLKDLE